jgi:hypothetical protein
MINMGNDVKSPFMKEEEWKRMERYPYISEAEDAELINELRKRGYVIGREI